MVGRGIGLGFGVLLSLAVTAAAQSQGRPNILFIMTDDHAAHAISAYGSRVNRTPHLDRLAREGAILDERLRDQLHLHAQPSGDPDRSTRT